MQETLIQIKSCSDDIPFSQMGVFNIKTSDAEFIDEVQKYTCPFRIVVFLDENKGRYKDVFDEYSVSNPSIQIDLSEQYTKVYSDESIPMAERTLTLNYVEFTKNKLDKYGNPLK
ncbi:MAG: hypothetical protein ACOX39_00160 [Arcobacteraceae bacterium]